MNSSTTSQPLSPRQLWPLILFTAAYLLAALAGVVLTGNGEFVFYLVVMVVMVVLLVLVVVIHQRVHFSRTVLWGLSLWGALHMAGGLLAVPDSWPINGEIRVLYSLWLVPGYLKYDQLVHAFGFGVTTLVCWEGLRSIIRPHLLPGTYPQTTLGMVTLCAAAAMGFGALNEIVEFAATLLVPETNVGGYENTGWDLVANMMGAVSVATWLYLKGNPKHE
jgi:uncharacterized membrane protein YjdF